jgi:tetratricopeptide (TPR) repeat protein
METRSIDSLYYIAMSTSSYGWKGDRLTREQQGIAATLCQLANVYHNQGKVSEAIELYEQSLEMNKAIGNQQGIATTLCMLGQMISIHQSDFDTAFDYLQQSEAILRHIGSPMADQVVEIIQQLQEIRADRSP